jgi:hypothetical protein
MGQFSETFQRKSGGHYIRTLGYINDGHRYRLFFMDLSKIITKRKKVKRPTNAQPDIQSRFSPAQQAQLSTLTLIIPVFLSHVIPMGSLMTPKCFTL